MRQGANGCGTGLAGAALNPKPANFTNLFFWRNNPGEKISRTGANAKGMITVDETPPMIATKIKDENEETQARDMRAIQSGWGGKKYCKTYIYKKKR